MEARVLLRKLRLPTLPSFLFCAKTFPKGFSLVEVVLALGIVSFSLVGILSMFPVALDTATDSKNETRVTFIAQSIFSDLQFSQPANASVMLKQVSSATDYQNPTFVKSQSLAVNFLTQYVAYDREGRPLQSISSNDFSGRYTNAQAGFVASISTNASPMTGLARVDVAIVSPPQAGSSSNTRKTNFFTTYLPTQ
jgi:uncharacterized protein (TIGR02598 family)